MKNQELQSMSLYDALSLARAMSGKSVDDVAAAMGWSPSNANRIFSRENYWPTLPNIPRLCVTLGNPVLVDWVRAQIRVGGVEFAAHGLDSDGLCVAMGELFKELGDVAGVANDAIKDRLIDKDECRRLQRELRDVHAKCVELTNKLRAMDPVEE